MKKKSLYSLLLMLVMIFSFSLIASAEWRTDNGNTYYYKGSTKLTLGPHTIAGKKYLFKKDGTLIKDKATIYKGHTYMSREDGSLITSFATYKNNIYYGTSKGYCKRYLQTYNKKTYYFSKDTGAAVKNKLVTYKKNSYYFQSNGQAAKSKFVTINGGKYYFDANGKLLKGGLKRIGNSYYLLGKKTGKMQVGSVKYNKYWYYLDETNTANRGKALTNGWKTINGKEYYYNAQARRQTGWLVLGNKKYYLNPSKNGAKTYGKLTIKGKSYDFGTKGYITNKLSGNKLVLKVNRKSCVVTVYDNGIPVKAMTCSTGASGSQTPVGTFAIQDHLSWWTLNGPSYGQYCSHFLPSYLFHSVPVYGTTRNPYGVNASDYNRLGSPASGGCIRLAVADAKWIYYNVPIGSTVVISDSEATPLGKPTPAKMKAGTKGADPTDDFKNPGGYDVKIKK